MFLPQIERSFKSLSWCGFLISLSNWHKLQKPVLIRFSYLRRQNDHPAVRVGHFDDTPVIRITRAD